MSNPTPPIEVQRFGRSQTPESPRPLHAPQPSNIPVLHNQMDPVFNDTATYDIPNNNLFPPYSEQYRNFPDSSAEDHDPVQSFFRGAEAESFLSQDLTRQEQSKLADATVAQPTEPAALSVSTEHNDNDLPASASALLGPMPAPSSQQTASFPSLANEKAIIQAEDAQAFSSYPASQALPPSSSAPSDTKSEEGGVDYQSLLDTIAQSASTAPPADAMIAPNTAVSDAHQPTKSFPSIPGLPPKPPTQDASPEFASDQTSQAMQLPPIIEPGTQPQVQQGSRAHGDMIVTQTGSGGVHANGVMSLPPMYQIPAEMSYPAPIDTTMANTHQAYGPSSAPGDRPWTPNTQRVYDKFLEEERGYVTEGIWDKFPNGSRLFVGNLASEKVTKRDLFHIFHKHGRLAQISIKQAYGFVQFLESSSCHTALQAEQGSEIRGRKIHLEVSKPQKNTRGSGAAGGPGANKSNVRRRSRSPERSRSNNDRFAPRPTFNDHESARRREEFRPGRSPSPRRYRSRDDYRSAQSPYAYQFPDSRPRSPAMFPAFPPPFPAQGYDEDAALPIPRREPQDIPDVQLLILDPSVAPPFINWVEQTFRSKGLRASTIWLNPRLPLQSVIKRQIIEGVQAIVKLIQNNQFNSKVPLQVFDRSAGASNVNFNEYVDLDVSVAADIVLHARSKERGMVQQSPQTQYFPGTAFPPPTPFGHHIPQQSPQQYSPAGPPQFHQQRPPPIPPPDQFSYHPHQSQFPQHSTSATPTGSTPNLQQLLANLGQTPNAPVSGLNQPSAQGHRQADLGGLLSNIAARHQHQAQPYSHPPPQPLQQGYGNQTGTQGFGTGQQSNVQNIMDQLARYQR